MTFSWTPHRFSGGTLAFDVANSVILRHDAAARRDRFCDPAEIDRFCEAASQLSHEKPGALSAIQPGTLPAFLELREAIDGHFRHQVREGRADHSKLATLLSALATTFARHKAGSEPRPLDLATAQSALILVSSPDTERLRICRHCGWLFVDRSRNRSRIWCDMAVCGNRIKARRHHQRQKDASP